jgi:hypothetical protein
MTEGTPDQLLEVMDAVFSQSDATPPAPQSPGLSPAALRAARTILEKLRRAPKRRAAGGTVNLAEIRRILARCRQPPPPAVVSATETPRDTLDLFEERLEEALTAYVQSTGTVRSPVLPDPRYLDGASCVVYGDFLSSRRRNELRWALARILLGLENQWWWFGSTMTPWQREEILRAVRQRYEDVRGPTPVGGDPWGRDVSRLMLLSQCRDILLALAFAYNWDDPI